MVCRRVCSDCCWCTCNFHPSYPLILEIMREGQGSVRGGGSRRRAKN